MANLKISQLPLGNPVQSGDQFPINRAGSNFRVSGLLPLASPALTGTPTVNGNSLVPASEILETSFITLTPSQIVTLDNTVANAITLIAAPGAGLTLMPDFASMNLQFNSTPYATGNGFLGLWLGSSGGLLNQTVSTNVQLSGNSNGMTASASILSNGPCTVPNGMTVAQAVNAPIYVGLSNATKYTAGNSNVVIQIRYRILSTIA